MVKLFRKNIIKIGITGLAVIGVVSAGLVYLNMRGDVKDVRAGWFNDNWSYRKQIVINSDYVTGDLTDFPVLISFTDAQVASHTQPTGGDIIFIDSEGKKLAHEIESFATSSTGAFVGWVKVPSLSSTDDTVLNMYYGNATVEDQQDAENVWDDNYVGVWHLPDSDTASSTDSTNNNNDGVVSNATTTSSGQINGAMVFDGANNYMTIGNDKDFSDLAAGSFSISAWFKSYDSGTTHTIVGRADGTNDDMFFYLFVALDDVWFRIYEDGDNGGNECQTNSTGDIVSDNTWYRVEVIWDASSQACVLYLDDSLQQYDSAGFSLNQTAWQDNENTYIGARDDGSLQEHFNGLIDEVRISNVRRSTSSIETSYNNQNSPSTFLSVQAEETGPGPVGYWSFDEGYGTTANDESGQGNDGTITGALWQDESMCVSGKCLYFDGTDDYVDMGLSDVWNNLDDMTFSMWFKPNSLSGTNQLGGTMDNDTNTSGFVLYWYSNELYFQAYTTSDIYVTKAYTDTNEWMHISGVAPGNGNGDLEIYLNGMLVATDESQNSEITDSPDNLVVGANSDKGSRYFHGFIDEVKIYPYARTADEIRQDYAAGKAGIKSNTGVAASFGSQSDSWMSDGLVGYWKMDESATTSGAIDASGNGNDGTYEGHASTTAGKFGNGGVFDGVEDRVNLGGTSLNSQTYSALSISAWYKSRDDTYQDGETITYGYSTDGGSNKPFYHLGIGDGEITWEIVSCYGCGVGWGGAYPAIDVRDQEWHHIVGVRTGGGAESRLMVYVDGNEITNVVDGSKGGDMVFNPSGEQFYFGGYGNIPDDAIDGTIDELRIYNRALSPREVQQLYEWAPGPVAHWRFDELSGDTAYDSIASSSFAGGNDGDLGASDDCPGENNCPMWDRGKYGSALNFDGSDDYVVITKRIKPPAFSVALWFKGDAFPAGDNSLYFNGSSQDNDWGVLVEGTNLKIEDDIYNTGFELYSTAVNTGRWYHVVAGKDSSGYNFMYLDGILVGNDQLGSGASLDETSGLSAIGTTRSQTEDVFDGIIDDVRIYNYALTPKQINEVMQGGSGGLGKLGGSPVGSWSMDEGYGIDIHDESGRGNHGTTSASWQDESMCISDKCLQFDGVDDKLTIPNSASLTFGYTDDFTYSTWFKIGECQSSGSKFVQQYEDSSNSMKFECDSADNLLAFIVEFGGSTVEINSRNTVTDNKWHYAVGIKNGSNNYLYLDGKLETQNSTSYGSGQIDTDVTIGYDVAGGARYVDGFMDEVKIYSFALSKDEIEKEYNAGWAGLKSKRGAAQAMGMRSKSWMTDGLVGYWKMDEVVGTYDGTPDEAVDSSGNANHGTAAGNASTTAGKFGNGGVFDGSGDYVSTNNSDYLSNFSVSAWVKITGGSGTYRTMVAKAAASGNERNFQLSLDNGDYAAIAFTDSPSSYHSVGTPVLTEDVWHHLVGTFDETILTIYLNGVGYSETHPYAPQNVGTINAIGRLGNYSGEYFDGQIDEVRIYNRALSPREVKQLYEWAPGPVLELKFDEQTGSTTYDTSGYGNDGVFVTPATSPRWDRGKYGSALRFDGSDDSVIIANDSSLNLTRFTVSFWMYANEDTDTTEIQQLIHKTTDNTNSRENYAFSWKHTNSDFQKSFSLYDGSSWEVAQISSTMNKETWYQITGSYNGTDLKVYLNGNIEDTEPSSNPQIGNYSMAIGSGLLADSPKSWFNGLIDHVKIYNYARTPAQIALDYNAGRPQGKPIAEWRFNECAGGTIHDESGNGNHGQLYLGTTGVTATGTCASSSNSFWYNGKDGKRRAAGSFDGVQGSSGDDYIVVNDNSILDITDNFTVSAWIYPESWGELYGRIVQKGNNSTNRYILYINGVTQNLSFTNDNDDYRSSIGSITLNSWQHVLVTYSGTNIKFYINGKQDGSVLSMGSLDNNDDPLYIGNRNTNDRTFDGLIDDVKIWNYALTAEQVRTEYSGGAVRFGN